MYNEFFLSYGDVVFGFHVPFFRRNKNKIIKNAYDEKLHYLTKNIDKALDNEKTKLPIVCGLSKYAYNNKKENISLIFADFDDLTPITQYNKVDKTWECVKLWCEDQIKTGCVLTTPSKKTKVAFLVRNISSSEDALTWLKLHLGEMVFKCLDKQGAAAIQCYMNRDMRRCLNEWLSSSNAVVHEYKKEHNISKSIDLQKQFNLEATELNAFITNNESTHTWLLNTKVNSKQYKANSASNIIFQFLAAKPDYVLWLSEERTGVGLLQSYIAKLAGISQQTISCGIRKAVSDGNLVITTGPVWGKKATNYYVSGSWKQELEELLPKETKVKKSGKIELPSVILDGNWNVAIGYAALILNTPEAFFGWLMSIKGWEISDRLNKAVGWWNKKVRECCATPITADLLSLIKSKRLCYLGQP